MHRSDKELVAACRAGDESAWEAIVLRHQRFLFSIVRRSGLDPDMAGDVLQEVFTALFERIGTLEQPEYLRAWLVSTARHKMIHAIRRESRGRVVPLDDEDEFFVEPSDSAPLADELFELTERDRRIGAAFELLDDRCRRLLSMLYLETRTLPYAEVSETLSIPLGSIGPTRARCIEKLSKMLEE